MKYEYKALSDEELERVIGGVGYEIVPDCFYDGPVTSSRLFPAECADHPNCPYKTQCYHPNKQ